MIGITTPSTSWPLRARYAGLVAALGLIDLILIAIHATHVRYNVPGSGLWLISRDRGIPEMFQYLKEAAIVCLLLASFLAVRSAVHLAWVATFAYFLVDDSLEVHEEVGTWLADALGLAEPFGIEGRDVGQILVSAAVGLVLLLTIAGATLGDRSPARPLTGKLIPILIALAFFGVVADVIDVIDVLGLVEDGGEMVAMSVAVAIVADHWHRMARRPSTTGDIPPIPAEPEPRRAQNPQTR